MSSPDARIVIIGGGISGLAVAHRLTELRRQRALAYELLLLEGATRLGGVIETQRRGGFLLEAGPDAFLAEQPAAVSLCRRIGLGDALIQTQPAYRRSFMVFRGRLEPVPQGIYLMAPGRLATLWRTPFVSWSGKLRMACEPLIARRRATDDESVAGFVRRRLGQEAFERLAQPMIGGIYAADPERLSLQATFPRFLEMERRHGSVVRGLRARTQEASQAAAQASGPRYSLFVSLQDGLQSLIEALQQRVPDATIRTGARVARLEPGATWRLELAGGERLEADAVCVALPAHQAASLLESAAPALAAQLRAIPYESVATVNAAFRRQDVAHPLHGFGFVAPAIERRQLIGCTFANRKFAGRSPQDDVLLRAFVGGALQPGLLELDDAHLERIVLSELRELLGIRAAPRLVTIHRFRQAMPQYHVGHMDRVAAIEQAASRYPGLILTGNGYRGLGLPDCIRQAEAAAERLIEFFHAPQAPAHAR